jgi:copper homeostasis protein CutC
MKRDVKAAKDLKAPGVVFGLLREDGSVDLERTKEFEI